MGKAVNGGSETVRSRWQSFGHRPGAAIIAALAVTDLAYRLLMREPLRRKLGVETRHA